MCIATISMIAGIAGAGISAAGTLESGMYAGQVADNNSKIEAQNANYAMTAGNEQSAVESLKGASQLAHTKTSLAANNVDVNSGSAVDVLASEREANTLDAETALNNADLTAYGYTTQSTNDAAQAQQDQVGAIYGAAGTLASKASSINWQNFGSMVNSAGTTGTGTTGELGGWGAST